MQLSLALSDMLNVPWAHVYATRVYLPETLLNENSHTEVQFSVDCSEEIDCQKYIFVRTSTQLPRSNMLLRCCPGLFLPAWLPKILVIPFLNAPSLLR